MKILMEHGGFGTLGDIAQTEMAIRSLRKVFPSCRVIIRRNPGDAQLDLGQDGTFVSPCAGAEEAGALLQRLARVRGLGRVSEVLLDLRRGCIAEAIFWGAFTKRRLGVALALLAERRRFFDLLAEADLFMAAGCGALTDLFPIAGILTFGSEIRAACAMGKPVVLMGQGLGPIRPGWLQRFTASCLQRADYLTTREEDSLRLLKEIGGMPRRCELGVDDAHPYTPNPNEEQAVEKFLASLPRPLITLNLRQRSYVAMHERFMDVFAEGIERILTQTGGSLVWAPMTTAGAEAEKSFKPFSKRLKRKEALKLLPAELWRPGGVKALQSRADLAIGGTYHFLLFALSAGVPVLGVYFNDYYRRKLCGLMAQYGFENGAMHGERVSAETLSEQALAMLREADRHRSALLRRSAELSLRHEETYRRLADLVRAR